MTGDCNGGVLTSVTDENGKATNYSYTNNGADPFWRIKSFTDPLNNVTSFSYTPTTVESVLNFGTSTIDSLTTFDGFGRVLTSQQRLGPGSGNFDTVSQTYDANGRVASISMPCVAASGASCPASPATSYSYDALNRTKQVTDGGGGYTSFGYTGRDVLQTRGPAPAGENLKKRQYEYDGVGRLTSACEILSSGGTSCNQSTVASGYATSYTYSVPGTGGSQFVVAQGAQSRTYQFDMLGRQASEANPESGTTTYSYDVPTANCSNSVWNPYMPGTLVQKVDAKGNYICYDHDALGRLMAFYVPVGPNATQTCISFSYDNGNGTFGQGSPAGATLNNLQGRLVEAETDDCAWPRHQSDLFTDEWFSYSPRGEITDLWESTAHSGGYYHTTASYFPDGVMQTLSGVPGQSTINYGVDGMGRPYSATQGSTALANWVSYNAAGLRQGDGMGLGDNDTYTFDQNTNRMTGAEFTLGTTNPITLLIDPVWNANGTLYQQIVLDQIFGQQSSGGQAQTCTYSYDDLARVSWVSCIDGNNTTVWSQTFSYDRYGNITKSGSISWAPGYNAANNRYANGSTYDNDGNLVNDTFATYTWNAYGKPATVTTGSHSLTLTYDAFGALVEKQDGSAYTEMLYSPIGYLGTMNGQSVVNIDFPLPGGLTYRTSQAGFIHLDWLGSGRLLSSRVNRTGLDGTAYAPFGEPYAQTGTLFNFTGDNADVLSASNDNSGGGGFQDTPNRELRVRQGRWISPDPAGLAAVDMTNPQTWNRYAYVGNNPCSAIDPLGLADCTFDIALIGNNLLTSEQLVDTALRINSIFSPAGVNVTFSRSNPDFSANFVAGGPAGKFGETPVTFWGGAPGTGLFSPGDTATIYIPNIVSEVNGQNVGTAVGEVVSHEFSHFLFGSRFAGESYDVNNIVVEGGDQAKMLNPNVGFTADDLKRISALCQKLHPNSNNSKGQSGGGGNGNPAIGPSSPPSPGLPWGEAPGSGALPGGGGPSGGGCDPFIGNCPPVK